MEIKEDYNEFKSDQISLLKDLCEEGLLKRF